MGLIWVILTFHILLTVEAGTIAQSPLVRSPIFVFAAAMNLFVMPKLIDFDDFIKIVAIISALVVLVGLPSYLWTYDIIGITIEPYRGIHDLLGIGKYQSVFGGPNQQARFALGGFLGSIVLATYYDRRFAILIPINGLGIFLGYSRATVVTTIAVSILYAVHLLAPRRSLQVATIGAISGIVVLFAMMVEVIPGPEFITGIDASGREILWRGGVDAWRQRPIFGLGPGNNRAELAPFIAGTGQEGSHVHNSYLRMLMSTGIFGFLAYVYFHIQTIWTGLKLVDNPVAIGALMLVVAYTINQITNIFSLFGFTVTSVVLALSFGYLLNEISSAGSTVSDDP